MSKPQKGLCEVPAQPQSRIGRPKGKLIAGMTEKICAAVLVLLAFPPFAAADNSTSRELGNRRALHGIIKKMGCHEIHTGNEGSFDGLTCKYPFPIPPIRQEIDECILCSDRVITVPQRHAVMVKIDDNGRRRLVYADTALAVEKLENGQKYGFEVEWNTWEICPQETGACWKIISAREIKEKRE